MPTRLPMKGIFPGQTGQTENDISTVSIFVNHVFDPKRTLRPIPAILTATLPYSAVHGCCLYSFHKEMYPTAITPGSVNKHDVLEGAVRPGHFKGVTTVVNKLFNIMEPTKAYFGQKDAQQAAVIRKMVKDLNMPLEVVVCPTIREKDGLAMSSRNTYLTPEMRQNAPVLYKSLQKALDMYRSGEKDATRIKQAMTDIINSQPIGVIDYISIVITRR